MASEDKQYQEEFRIKTYRYFTPTDDDHSALRLAFEKLAKVRKVKVDYGWDGGNQHGT